MTTPIERLRDTAIDTFFMHTDDGQIDLELRSELLKQARLVDSIASYEEFFNYLIEVDLEDRYSMIACAAYAISGWDDDDNLFLISSCPDLTDDDKLLIEKLYAELKTTI